jgi:hypothetical protein
MTGVACDNVDVAVCKTCANKAKRRSAGAGGNFVCQSPDGKSGLGSTQIQPGCSPGAFFSGRALN